MTPPHGSSSSAPRHHLLLQISGFPGDIRESLSKLRRALWKISTCLDIEEKRRIYDVILEEENTEGENASLSYFVFAATIYCRMQIVDFPDSSTTSSAVIS